MYSDTFASTEKIHTQTPVYFNKKLNLQEDTRIWQAKGPMGVHARAFKLSSHQTKELTQDVNAGAALLFFYYLNLANLKSHYVEYTDSKAAKELNMGVSTIRRHRLQLIKANWFRVDKKQSSTGRTYDFILGKELVTAAQKGAES